MLNQVKRIVYDPISGCLQRCEACSSRWISLDNLYGYLFFGIARGEACCNQFILCVGYISVFFQFKEFAWFLSNRKCDRNLIISRVPV